jgi:hypothetical protein
MHQNVGRKIREPIPTTSKPATGPNRGHALTIDSGWREVAEKALAFVRRFA